MKPNGNFLVEEDEKQKIFRGWGDYGYFLEVHTVFFKV